MPDDVQKMAGFFGRLGYREQLPEIRHDPGSQALRRALSEWLNGPDRQATDTAVIYYSGHGDSQANLFYLLTADSQENRYADTALRADYVLEALGETPKVRRVLLILDACYAGQGAFNAADVAARMSPWQSFRGDDEGVWVVAAASPKQEAQERLFTDAFLEAAGQLEQTTGTLQPYIGLEALIEQINSIFRRSGKKQRASWIPVTQPEGWPRPSPTRIMKRTLRQTWTWRPGSGCAVGAPRSSPSTGGPRRAVSRSPRRSAGISRVGKLR